MKWMTLKKLTPPRLKNPPISHTTKQSHYFPNFSAAWNGCVGGRDLMLGSDGHGNGRQKFCVCLEKPRQKTSGDKCPSERDWLHAMSRCSHHMSWAPWLKFSESTWMCRVVRNTVRIRQCRQQPWFIDIPQCWSLESEHHHRTEALRKMSYM